MGDKPGSEMEVLELSVVGDAIAFCKMQILRCPIMVIKMMSFPAW